MGRAQTTRNARGTRFCRPCLALRHPEHRGPGALRLSEGTIADRGGGATTVFVHTQGAAASTWNISHGLGTEVINYITYDNANEQIYPDTFTIDDANNVTITWASSQDGLAYIFSDTSPTSIGDLQFAYDAGDGTISITGGKPLELTGTGELTAVTGTFTSGLTVGEGSTTIFNESITTGSGIFTDTLTVSGIPVDIGGGGGGGAAFRGAKVTLIDGGVAVGDQVKQKLSFQVDLNVDPPDYDTDGFLTASGNDFLEIPAALDGSRVRLTGQTLWPDNAIGFRSGNIRKTDGGSFSGSPFQTAPAITFVTFNMITPIITVTGGQQFALYAWNAAGGGADGSTDTQTIPKGNQTWFSIEVVEE